MSLKYVYNPISGNLDAIPNALPISGGTLTGPVDFGGFDSKNFAIECGATLPASPYDCQPFIHTPTGRAVLMVYKNSAWNLMQSFGSMVMYVDGTNGTDSVDKGFGTGTDAFATVQYAVDRIPGLYGGNVTINVAAGTYRETVTLQGKFPIGKYTITVIGAWTTSLGNTTASSAADRTSATATASITKTSAGWTVNAYQNKMLYIVSGTGSGQYRPILSNTSDTIYVEAWVTKPDNTSHFIVYDWGTRITGSDAGADTTPVRNTVLDISSAQDGIVLQNLKLDYANLYNVYCEPGSASTNINNCNISNSAFYNIWFNMANGYVRNCLVNNAGNTGITQNLSSIEVYDSVLIGNVTGMWSSDGGLIYAERNRLDGTGTTGGIGLYARRTGNFGLGDTHSIVNYTGGGYGAYSEFQATISNGTSQFFSNNTTNYGDFSVSWDSQRSGTDTLSSGTKTITNALATTSSIIVVSDLSGGTNIGTLKVSRANGSFTVSSTNILDNSGFTWYIVAP